MHFRTSALLLTLLAFFMFSSSCDEEQDTVQDVSNPSFSTSPQQLGDWFEQLTAIVKLNGTSAPEASRIFAYASIAFYEGFTMSDPTMRTLEGQIDGLENIPRPSVGEIYNYGIIAESAMTEVLYHGFDGTGSLIQNVIRSTYQNHENRYADIGVESPIIERSREHGKLLADIIIAWMDTDGYDQVMTCEDTLASGSDVWQPTPPSMLDAELPCWGQLRAFTFGQGDINALCLTTIPAAVSSNVSSDYMTQVNEMLVSAENLTEEQKGAARFWNDGPGTSTAPGHYLSLFRQLITQKQLSGKQTAIMFAQLCIAMADVHIVMYHDKFKYSRPRPITFIRAQGFQNWTSFNVNPPTPEYPCVRAGLGYAAGQVFTNIYGNEPFTDDSQYLFGLPPRSYQNFNEMANEVALAQFYGGTNYRATVLASEYTARCIAQRSNELFLNQ